MFNPKRSSWHARTLLFALLAICCAESTSFAQATQLFVDDTAQGLNNGSSWQHAYIDFQSALSDPSVAAGSVLQLFVAEGTYKPSVETTSGNQLTKTFMLPAVSQSLLILGGFPNGGGPIGSEDPELYKTYLDGDRELPNDNDSQFEVGTYTTWADNVYHVCTAINTSDNVTLDGFVIRGGSARIVSGVTSSELGGGMVCLNANPTIRNCTFTHNLSQGDQAPRVGCGGGLYSNAASLDIRDCTFRYCHASIAGGGLCKFEGDLTAVRCDFEKNRAQRGAGIRVDLTGGEVHFINCIFEDDFGEQTDGPLPANPLQSP